MCEGKLSYMAFCQIAIQMYEKKSSHTQIVICTYIETNTATNSKSSEMESMLQSIGIETTYDATIFAPSVVLLLSNTKAGNPSAFNEWVRDPFIVAHPNGQIHALESTIYNSDSRCSSQSRSQNADLAEMLLNDAGIINAIANCEDCFSIAGGNILSNDGVVLVGGNEFEKMAECLNLNEAQTKLKLATRIGVNVEDIFIIGYSDGQSNDGKNLRKNEVILSSVFNASNWYAPLTLATHPRIRHELKDFPAETINSLLNDGKEVSLTVDIQNIKGLIADIVEDETERYSTDCGSFYLQNNYIKLQQIEKVNNLLTRIVESLFAFSVFVHIDLFLTITGEKTMDGKHVVFLAEIVNVANSNLTLSSLNGGLDLLAQDLSNNGRFEVYRNPVAYIESNGYYYYSTYNNCLVENCKNGKTVWLPDFALSTTFDPALRNYQKQNADLWKKLGFKVRFVMANFEGFAKRQGSLHCLTKELYREPC